MADDDTPAAGAEAPNEGWQRLGRLMSYAFSKHTPGEQLPPVPEELKEWAQDTTLATFAGMVLGGLRQWLEERRAGPIVAPADAPTKAHKARAIAEEQTQRLARVSNSTLKGGLRVGGLAAVFYAVQMLSGIYRNRRDFHDTAYGGMAAGALLGLSLNGTSRLRSTILGAALGASIGVPAGLLQDKVVEWMPEELKTRRAARFAHTEDILSGAVKPSREMAPVRDYDVTAAVIAQLEASLSSSPAQQLHQEQQQEGGPAGTGRRQIEEGKQQQQQQQGEQADPAGKQQQQQEAGGPGRRWWRLW